MWVTGCVVLARLGPHALPRSRGQGLPTCIIFMKICPENVLQKKEMGIVSDRENLSDEIKRSIKKVVSKKEVSKEEEEGSAEVI